MTTRAVIVFQQSKTSFAAEGSFQVEFDDGQTHDVKGGCDTKIRLETTGTLRIRATIDKTYSSPWTSIGVADGDIVILIINPPGSSTTRAFGLFGKANYLAISEIARRRV